jgi:2-polyprenyl-6-methoxyphenol hydroxylase-like FAD-dependent oxidoreductase
MKPVAGPSSEMYRAVKTLMERVPALKADGRPESLQSVAKQLASQGVSGASLVAQADAATLTQVRLDVLKDLYEAARAGPSAALSGDARAPAGERPTALISGGSYTGMIAAAALAKSGQNVVLLEPRPNHSREIRLGARQGMIDTLAMLDPKLAQEFLKRASKLDPEGFKVLTLPAAKPGFKSLAVESREPDGAKVPQSGAELMKSEYTHIIVAREFESLVEQYVKQTYGDRITFVEGKLHPVKQDDGNMKWEVEKAPATRGGAPIYEPLLEGKKPSVVLVAEGSGSTTRTAFGIDYKETTPTQFWTAGVINTTDKDTKQPGDATLRVLYEVQQTGETKTPERAVAISDGKTATWVLTQMAPGFAPDPRRPQAEINDYYFQRASLVTGQDEAKLREAGASGPFAAPNSVPTAFGLVGKAASEAARVMPDGTVVGFLGDTVQTSTFQAGGGMNTAVAEVLPVLTLMEDLQSGVSAKAAAAKFQDAIFERGSAWSSTGIPYFYDKTTESKTQELIGAQLKAIDEWRKAGGGSPTPLERMQAILANSSTAAEPVGLKIAA